MGVSPQGFGYLGPAVVCPPFISQERIVDKEKAGKVKAVIAEVIGFEVDEVQDTDRFIIDYSVTYTERKALLERLNAAFGKDLDFTTFCALDDVASVVKTYGA